MELESLRTRWRMEDRIFAEKEEIIHIIPKPRNQPFLLRRSSSAVTMEHSFEKSNLFEKWRREDFNDLMDIMFHKDEDFY